MFFVILPKSWRFSGPCVPFSDTIIDILCVERERVWKLGGNQKWKDVDDVTELQLHHQWGRMGGHPKNVRVFYLFFFFSFFVKFFFNLVIVFFFTIFCMIFHCLFLKYIIMFCLSFLFPIFWMDSIWKPCKRKNVVYSINFVLVRIYN